MGPIQSVIVILDSMMKLAYIWLAMRWYDDVSYLSNHIFDNKIKCPDNRSIYTTYSTIWFSGGTWLFSAHHFYYLLCSGLHMSRCQSKLNQCETSFVTLNEQLCIRFLLVWKFDFHIKLSVDWLLVLVLLSLQFWAHFQFQYHNFFVRFCFFENRFLRQFTKKFKHFHIYLWKCCEWVYWRKSQNSINQTKEYILVIWIKLTEMLLKGICLGFVLSLYLNRIFISIITWCMYVGNLLQIKFK